MLCHFSINKEEPAFFTPNISKRPSFLQPSRKQKTTNLTGQPASRHKKQFSSSPKTSKPWIKSSKSEAKNAKRHFRDAAISFCFFEVEQPLHQSAPRGLDSELLHIDWQPSPKVLFS